jgi:tRNA threonylcarbamoyladenosine biosynthesis protein TsaE
VNGLKAAAPEEVSSPTFTLIHEYGGGRAYRIDLYRLEEAREAATLGLEQIFDRKAVVLIEWGERFPQLIPEEHIEIRLKATSDDARLLDVKGLRIEQCRVLNLPPPGNGEQDAAPDLRVKVPSR